MKYFTILTSLALLVAGRPAFCGEVIPGPPITAEDLAQQMGIFVASVTYKQERPFTSISYVLDYKERNADGTYTEKAALSSSGYRMRSPATERTFKILFDPKHSTVISYPNTSGGQGFDLAAQGAIETQSPPALRDGGGYVLATVMASGGKTDSEELIKGIVELEITAQE